MTLIEKLKIDFWEEAARNDGIHGTGENIPARNFIPEFLKVVFIPGYSIYNLFKIIGIRERLGIYSSEQANSARISFGLKTLFLTGFQVYGYVKLGETVYRALR